LQRTVKSAGGEAGYVIQPEYTVREATFDDLGLLFEARRRMLTDMGAHVAEEDLRWLESALTEFIEERLTLGPIGFIAEDPGGLLVGAVSISHEVTLPNLHNPSGRVAYLYGMWVRPDSRRRGVARALVSTAVEAARAVGAGAVTLMSSDEGRLLYEGLGFVSAPSMRLSFEPLFEWRSKDGESC
jgi:GNAT superfamily N-acetyltransferase